MAQFEITIEARYGMYTHRNSYVIREYSRGNAEMEAKALLHRDYTPDYDNVEITINEL